MVSRLSAGQGIQSLRKHLALLETSLLMARSRTRNSLMHWSLLDDRQAAKLPLEWDLSRGQFALQSRQGFDWQILNNTTLAKQMYPSKHSRRPWFHHYYGSSGQLSAGHGIQSLRERADLLKPSLMLTASLQFSIFSHIHVNMTAVVPFKLIGQYNSQVIFLVQLPLWHFVSYYLTAAWYLLSLKCSLPY